MNLQVKKETIHERFASMPEYRLDELIPILRNPHYHFPPREGDSALTAFRMQRRFLPEFEDAHEEELCVEKSIEAFHRAARKRNVASNLVDQLEEIHLQAVYDLLEETGDGIVLSAEEWARIEQDRELAEQELIGVYSYEEVIEGLRIKPENLYN